MNAEFKERWLAALRSGNYEQGTEYLHRDGKFCCLGVACDLLAKEGVLEVLPAEYGRVQYRSPGATVAKSGTLPDAAIAYMEVDCENPLINGKFDNIAEANDEGLTFLEIADIIEEQL